MHFFYMDESGDTGKNLDDKDQPIFVLGGISLRDEGWNKTHTEWDKIVSAYFDGAIPDDFELHSYQLLSPNGDGPFVGHDIQKRLGLAESAIDLLIERKHGVHFMLSIKSGFVTMNVVQIYISMPSLLIFWPLIILSPI